MTKELPMYIQKRSDGVRPYRFRRDFSIKGERRIVTFGTYKSLEEALHYYEDNLKTSDHFAKMAQELRDAQDKLQSYEQLFQPRLSDDRQVNDLKELEKRLDTIQRNQKVIANKLIDAMLE